MLKVNMNDNLLQSFLKNILQLNEFDDAISEAEIYLRFLLWRCPLDDLSSFLRYAQLAFLNE